jgi:hypothetical protein
MPRDVDIAEANGRPYVIYKAATSAASPRSVFRDMGFADLV